MPHMILIVDDNAGDRLLCQEWLRPYDYTFAEAETGTQGIQKCEEEPPSCIIVDYNMVDMDGFQFLITLRRELKNDTPLIFVTGQETEEIKRDALELGANAFVSKNKLNSETLHTLITQAIQAA